MLKLPYTTPEPKFVGWCAACRQPCGRYVEEFMPTQNIPTGKDKIVSNCCGAEILQEAPEDAMTQETPTPETDAAIAKRAAFLTFEPYVSAEFARSLERRLQEAERELDDFRATLNDERYCHGQTIAQLKNAASEEIQQQVERADKCSQIAHEEIAQRCKAEARAEALGGLLRELRDYHQRFGHTSLIHRIDATLSHPGITG